MPIGVELIVAAQRRQAGTRGREAHLGNQKCRRRGSKNYGQRPETGHFTVHRGTLRVPRTDMRDFMTEYGRQLTFGAKHGEHPAGNVNVAASHGERSRRRRIQDGELPSERGALADRGKLPPDGLNVFRQFLVLINAVDPHYSFVLI